MALNIYTREKQFQSNPVSYSTLNISYVIVTLAVQNVCLRLLAVTVTRHSEMAAIAPPSHHREVQYDI